VTRHDDGRLTTGCPSTDDSLGHPPAQGMGGHECAELGKCFLTRDFGVATIAPQRLLSGGLWPSSTRVG
jgi:hypothetical protein